MNALTAATHQAPLPLRTAQSGPASRPNAPEPNRRVAQEERAQARLEDVRSGPRNEQRIDPSIMQDVKDDWQVNEATRPSLFDNQEAAELKQEYRQAYEKTEQGRSWAQSTAEEYGPGTHKLPNGEVVVVRDGPDGSRIVIKREADGSQRAVTYREDDPTSITVRERDEQGDETEWERDGTTVTVTRRGEENSSDVYSLGTGPMGFGSLMQPPNPDPGRPTRAHSEGDVMEFTEANADGSSDRRRFDLLTWDLHDRHTPGRDFRRAGE